MQEKEHSTWSGGWKQGVGTTATDSVHGESYSYASRLKCDITLAVRLLP